MSESRAWKDDFPVAWVDDHYVTRREFTKSLVLVSCAACAANGTLVALDAAKSGMEAGPFPERCIASVAEVPVGSSRVFDYPEPGRPCLLVRLDAGRFAAFSQKCTHLGCPVLFEAESRRLHCPCHAGWFDAEDGKVLAGPPPRPLARIKIEQRGDELWATGITR